MGSENGNLCEPQIRCMRASDTSYVAEEVCVQYDINCTGNGSGCRCTVLSIQIVLYLCELSIVHCTVQYEYAFLKFPSYFNSILMRPLPAWMGQVEGFSWFEHFPAPGRYSAKESKFVRKE